MELARKEWQLAGLHTHTSHHTNLGDVVYIIDLAAPKDHGRYQRQGDVWVYYAARQQLKWYGAEREPR
jgi:hypothetical protein